MSEQEGLGKESGSDRSRELQPRRQQTAGAHDRAMESSEDEEQSEDESMSLLASR
jgi:hypothetical protein